MLPGNYLLQPSENWLLDNTRALASTLFRVKDTYAIFIAVNVSVTISFCDTRISGGAYKTAGAGGFNRFLPERHGRRGSCGQPKPGGEGVRRRIGSSSVDTKRHYVGLARNWTGHSVGDNSIGSDKVEITRDRRGRGRPTHGQLQTRRLRSRGKAHRADGQHFVIVLSNIALYVDRPRRLCFAVRE